MNVLNVPRPTSHLVLGFFFSLMIENLLLKNESPHVSAMSLPTKNAADAFVGYFRPRHHVSISSHTLSPVGTTQGQTRSQRDIMRLNDRGWPAGR